MISVVVPVYNTELHLINRHSKYHIDQYYNHPKVTKQSVLKLIKEIG